MNTNKGGPPKYNYSYTAHLDDQNTDCVPQNGVTAASVLQLREQLFEKVTEQSELESDTLNGYKNQVQELRKSYQELKEADQDQLKRASDEIQRLQHGLAAAALAVERTVGASKSSTEELQKRVVFYQQSLIMANKQYEELQAESKKEIANIKAKANEKIAKSKLSENSIKAKYSASLMDAKIEQRKCQMDVDQTLRSTEKQLRQNYYDQSKELGVQRIKDLYNRVQSQQEDNILSSKNPVLTPMKAQSTFSPLSSPTNTINTNLNSRLVHLSTANEIEQLVAQVTELNAYKDNQGIIHQQLRSEIHALQEELLQRSQESGILTKLQNDLENQVNINSQLKDRINILTKEKLSMDEVKLELISKDRQIHSLQSSLTNAEKEAVIQKEKGFEEAVKCMEQDMTDLQDQIKSNRRSVESEYKSVVNELRQQRDQFEKELLATSKLLKERSSNGQSNSNFHDAINSADKIVSSVQKQVAWHEEKRKLVEKIELLLQKEAMYEQNRNIVGEEMKEKTVSMSKQISKLEKELVQSNHKLQIVEKERLLLQEKLHKMEALQQDININEKGTETHYSLKESEKMRILENELSATKYELAATQKIMADAKQNISDLKWENTSLRHDIFMAKTSESAPLSRFGSSITKSNTDNSNNSISNKNDDSISRTPPKPTTLDNYVYNTKTLTQVLSNTKPLRIRLEAATAANQRSRLTRLARTTRTRVTPDKVLTPQIGVQDFNRSDMMVNNDEKIGMSAVNLHLSPSLNPLGYYQPNLEGDI